MERIVVTGIGAVTPVASTSQEECMSTYRGIVQGHVVILLDGVELGEGTPVQVRVVSADLQDDADDMEDAFEAELSGKGFLTVPSAELETSLEDDDGDFRPIQVSGVPLSQLIIEERR